MEVPDGGSGAPVLDGSQRQLDHVHIGVRGEDTRRSGHVRCQPTQVDLAGACAVVTAAVLIVQVNPVGPCTTGHHVGVANDGDGVVARTAVEHIAACIVVGVVHHVVAFTALQAMTAGADVDAQRVIARAAPQGGLTGLAADGVVVVAAFQRVICTVAGKRVCSRAALQQVVACAAVVVGQVVIARTTDQGVAALVSIQIIVIGSAIQRVVACAAIQIVLAVVALDAVVACVSVQTITVVGHPFVGGVKACLVISIPAPDGVVARTAKDHIACAHCACIRGITPQHVVAIKPEQSV